MKREGEKENMKKIERMKRGGKRLKGRKQKNKSDNNAEKTDRGRAWRERERWVSKHWEEVKRDIKC